MSSFLTGFEVLQKVYGRLQTYGVANLSLPERSIVIAGEANLAGESSSTLEYEHFTIVGIPPSKDSYRRNVDTTDQPKLWVIGLGEGVGQKGGYAGDLVGININTSQVTGKQLTQLTGEQLARSLPRIARLQQSLVQALSDGPLAFQSTLSSRVARDAKEILSSYLVRSTGYVGKLRPNQFSGFDVKYREEISVNGNFVQAPDDMGEGEGDIEEKGESSNARETLAARTIGEKRNLVEELSDIVVRVLRVP